MRNICGRDVRMRGTNLGVGCETDGLLLAGSFTSFLDVKESCCFCAMGTNSLITLPLSITSNGGVFMLLCCFCNSGGGLVKSELVLALLAVSRGCG